MTLQEVIDDTSRLVRGLRYIDVTETQGGDEDWEEVRDAVLELYRSSGADGPATRIYTAAVALYQLCTPDPVVAPSEEGINAVTESWPDETPAQIARYIRRSLEIDSETVPYGRTYYPALAWYAINRMIAYVRAHGATGGMSYRYRTRIDDWWFYYPPKGLGYVDRRRREREQEGLYAGEMERRHW